MKKFPLIFFACSCLLFFLASTASAHVVDVYSEPNVIQDNWALDGIVHELGNKPPFPDDEWITSGSVVTTFIPCPTDYEPSGHQTLR